MWKKSEITRGPGLFRLALAWWRMAAHQIIDNRAIERVHEGEPGPPVPGPSGTRGLRFEYAKADRQHRARRRRFAMANLHAAALFGDVGDGARPLHPLPVAQDRRDRRRTPIRSTRDLRAPFWRGVGIGAGVSHRGSSLESPP